MHHKYIGIQAIASGLSLSRDLKSYRRVVHSLKSHQSDAPSPSTQTPLTSLPSSHPAVTHQQTAVTTTGAKQPISTWVYVLRLRAQPSTEIITLLLAIPCSQ